MDQKFSTTERGLAAAGLITFGVGCGFVAFVDPSSTRLLPACPLLEMTGFACPGCGLTRGFHALFNGDLTTALDFNLLIPIFVIGFAYVVVLLLSIVLRGRGLGVTAVHSASLWSILAIVITFGVMRNIPAYPFDFLFP